MAKMRADWRDHSDQRHCTMTCAVHGCYEPVARTTFSTLCMKHTARRRNVGHPTGKSVGWTQLDRYRRVYSNPFLAKYIGHHEGVDNAIAALDRLLDEAVAPASYGKHLSELQKTDYWLALLKRRGVTGQDVLSCVIAMDVLRMVDTALFKSDMHWRIQTAGRTMGLGNWRQSVGIPGHVQPCRAGLRTRELLLKRIMAPLGPLVLNATKKIMEDAVNYYDLDITVPGADLSFD